MIRSGRIPVGEPVSKDFAITLSGRPAQAYYARVSAIPYNRDWPGHQRELDQTELVSILSFSMDETVEIQIKPAKPFSNAVIRPLSSKLRPEIQAGTICLTIEQPGQYTLELDGTHHVLHIFADPAVDYSDVKAEENLLYYGAGMHYIGQVELMDNTAVYIDRDAFVYGAFYGVGAENIRIFGEGVLCGSWENRQDHNFIFPYDVSRIPEHMWGREGLHHVFGHKPQVEEVGDGTVYVPGTGTMLYQSRQQFKKRMEQGCLVKSGLHFYACRNVSVSGITVRDAAGLSNTYAACDGVSYDNVKIVGMWRYNSDGIDLYNCCNCLVKNCFVRTFDDGICVKGQTGWDIYNAENILVEKCVVWNEWGHSLEVGVDTVATEIRNITFRDCDCIHHAHSVMDIGNWDRARIHDVVFENIRVEYSVSDLMPVLQTADTDRFVAYPYASPLFSCTVNDPHFWSCDNIRGRNYDILVKDIQVLADYEMEFPEVIIMGIDEQHQCEHIVFENITINGKKIVALEEMRLQTNAFVKHIVLRDREEC